MGNFANTLFSVLLGWVQSAVSWLWGVIGADGADGAMGWVLDNWLALAIWLCLFGVVIDLLVYLVRWQPYRVWRSFLGKDDEDEEADDEAAYAPKEPLQWVYANGETMTEPVPEPEEEYLPQPTSQPTPRVIPARRRRSQPLPQEAQQAYYQPYYPPQWNGGTNHPTDGGTQS